MSLDSAWREYVPHWDLYHRCRQDMREQRAGAEAYAMQSKP